MRFVRFVGVLGLCPSFAACLAVNSLDPLLLLPIIAVIRDALHRALAPDPQRVAADVTDSSQAFDPYNYQQGFGETKPLYETLLFVTVSSGKSTRKRRWRRGKLSQVRGRQRMPSHLSTAHCLAADPAPAPALVHSSFRQFLAIPKFKTGKSIAIIAGAAHRTSRRSCYGWQHIDEEELEVIEQNNGASLFTVTCPWSRHKSIPPICIVAWAAIAVAYYGTRALRVAGQQCPGQPPDQDAVHTLPSKAKPERPSKPRGRPAKRKKRTKAGDSPEDTDNEGGGPNDPHSDQGGGGAGGELPRRYLDCPFHKFDRQTYRHCGKYGLTAYRHLTQHLERRHKATYYHCHRCMESFNTAEPWRAHSRQCTLEEIPGPETITPQEFERIKTEIRPHGLTDEDKWFEMWDILFAGHTRPSSAYVASDDETIELIRQEMIPGLQTQLPYLLLHHFGHLDISAVQAFGADIEHVLLHPPVRPRLFRKSPGWSSSNNTAADMQHQATLVHARQNDNLHVHGEAQTSELRRPTADIVLGQDLVRDEDRGLYTPRQQDKPAPNPTVSDIGPGENPELESRTSVLDNPSTQPINSLSGYLQGHDDTPPHHGAYQSYRQGPITNDDESWQRWLETSPEPDPGSSFPSNDASQAVYPPS